MYLTIVKGKEWTRLSEAARNGRRDADTALLQKSSFRIGLYRHV
jgi:hypothetical protein